MQNPLELVAPIFNFLTMIGSLIILIVTKYVAQAERLNIVKQVELYRKIQLENRLIKTFDRVVETLDEAVSVVGRLKRATIGQHRRELSGELQRMGRNLSRLSWRCGPFTDEVFQAGADVIDMVKQETPENETNTVLDRMGKLEEELKRRLRNILSEDLSELAGQS